MSGVIQGGWEFVWAAYGLTAAILGFYTLSIVTRFRSEKRRTDRRTEGLS